MQFVLIERFHAGDPVPVYKRLAEQGRMMPSGLHYVCSWVTEDLATCYQVVECEDRAPLDDWMKRWDDLIDFEVVPVITSAEAQAAVASKAR